MVERELKIPELMVSVPTRPIAFGDAFESSRMSEDDMKNAARFPEASPSSMSSGWQSEAMKLAQAPHVIAANLGLGAFRSQGMELLESIEELVSQEVFDLDTDVARFLRVASDAFSRFDEVSSALRAVPYVGAVLGVIVSVARTVKKSVEYRAPLPPQLKMDPVHDAEEVTAALQMIRSRGDWTPLFLPNEGPTNAEQGGWTMVQEDGGFRFGRGDRVTGFGCSPGDYFFVAKGVQARIGTKDVTIPNDSRTPRHSLILRKGQNPVSLRERVFSIGEWYPGLAALGRSVWSMINSPDSAAMFQVDGFALIEGWSNYHHSTARFKDAMDRWLGRELKNGSKRWKRDMIAGYLSHVGAAFHDVRRADGSVLSQEELLELALDANRRPVAQTVGMQAVRAASSLVKQQYAVSGTRLNALVSKDAPALVANRELRDHFLKKRAELQEVGRFDTVDLAEVPDESLRSKLVASRRTNPEGAQRPVGAPGAMGFADPVVVAREERWRREVELELIPKPPPMTGLGVPLVEPKPTQGSGRLLGATLVAAAGLGSVAFYAHRRRRAHRTRSARGSRP
jgi:hypothetical protein